MKKICSALLLCGMALTLAACNPTYDSEEYTTKYMNKVILSDNADAAMSYSASLYGFAANYTAAALSGRTSNFAVSPLSMVMDLSMAAECAAGTTREAILSALGVSYDSMLQNSQYVLQLSNKFSNMYVEKNCNSVWFDSSVSLKKSCLNSLENNFNCYNYKVDFKDNNAAANDKIRKFIKELTEDMIDKDYKLPQETVFALINTIYMKAGWKTLSGELSTSGNTYEFTNTDGSVYSNNFLVGNNIAGSPIAGENYTSFYTENYGGKIHFIVPKDGYDLNSVMTAENIRNVLSVTDYHTSDENYEYYTKCVFPEFHVDSRLEATSLLQNMGILKESDDFSNITDDAVGSNIIQDVVLDVSRKGVEGAAVTVDTKIRSKVTRSKQEVYQTLLVDKAFGFIVMDNYNNVLFAGEINQL